MRKTKKLTIEGLGDIEVKELTAAQVEELMRADMAERPFYVMEALLNRPLLIEAVSLSTGISTERLNGEITPSAAEAIWKAAEEVNGFLSRLMERLRDAMGDASPTKPEQ